MARKRNTYVFIDKQTRRTVASGTVEQIAEQTNLSRVSVYAHINGRHNNKYDVIDMSTVKDNKPVNMYYTDKTVMKNLKITHEALLKIQKNIDVKGNEFDQTEYDMICYYVRKIRQTRTVAFIDERHVDDYELSQYQ